MQRSLKSAGLPDLPPFSNRLRAAKRVEMGRYDFFWR